MKRTIFFKLFSEIFLLIVLLTSIIFFFSINTIKKHYINTLTYELSNFADVLQLSVTPLVKSGKLQELESTIKRIGKETNTRITVIAVDGTVLADSKKNPDSMENHRGRPEIREALERGFGKSIRYSTTVKERMLYLAVPIKSGGKLVGILRVSLFLKNINTLLGILKTKILYSIIIVTILSLLAAFLFSRNLISPIRDLAEASKKLAAGDFSTRLMFVKKDELGELSESFNTMSEKLKNLFEELKSKKEEFGGIISSLSEGLMVLNKDGRITLCNDSFKSIVSTEPVGKFYWEVLREPALLDSIDTGIKNGEHKTDEIDINGRKYLFGFSSIPETNELIIVLHDITELKRVEKLKRDFIANVSHELRTPLTAIKGYLETMEDEEGGNDRQYLEIVQKHTEHLINIVNDLLQLSDLERNDVKMNMEEVNLSELVRNVSIIFKRKAEKKGIELVLDCPQSIVMKGDPFKLEQMFVNLIDNAIKYTETGSVIVSLKCLADKIVIDVKDTGIGIPANYIDRIFERFFVADRSRSKKVGGTGLGLSIVKHIVLLHNGKIKVKSKIGEGTTFTVKFYLS